MRITFIVIFLVIILASVAYFGKLVAGRKEIPTDHLICKLQAGNSSFIFRRLRGHQGRFAIAFRLPNDPLIRTAPAFEMNVEILSHGERIRVVSCTSSQAVPDGWFQEGGVNGFGFDLLDASRLLQTLKVDEEYELKISVTKMPPNASFWYTIVQNKSDSDDWKVRRLPSSR